MAIVKFSGNLGGDPELSYTPSGTALAKFSVAETERIRDENGNWSDGDTTWWRCVAWKNLAEQIAENLAKGSSVLVDGRVKIREYDKDGEKKYATEVTVDKLGLDVMRIKPKSESRSSGYTENLPFLCSFISRGPATRGLPVVFLSPAGAPRSGAAL